MYVPINLKEKIEAQVDKKIKEVVQTCLDEIREHAQQTPPTFKNSKTLSTKLIVFSDAIEIFKDIFENEHELIFKTSTAPPTAATKDALLEGMERSIFRSTSHTIELIWLEGNRSVYGDGFHEIQCTYSPKEHLKTEWQAACEGRGTDITIKSKEANSSKDAKDATTELQAHKAKLIMHSAFFQKQLDRPKSQAFDDSLDTVVNLENCSLETFKRLLEFIYLGELPQEVTSNWEALKELYVAADFYEVKGAKELSLKGLNALIKQKKITDDVALLLDRGLGNGDEKLITLGFAHFSASPKIKKALVDAVNEKNWETTFALASKFPLVKEVLLHCAEYNPKLANVLQGNAEPKALSSNSSSNSFSSNSPSNSSQPATTSWMGLF